jgi:hypothetical protein
VLAILSTTISRTNGKDQAGLSDFSFQLSAFSFQLFSMSAFQLLIGVVPWS